jgi:hypothetical protein
MQAPMQSSAPTVVPASSAEPQSSLQSPANARYTPQAYGQQRPAMPPASASQRAAEMQRAESQRMESSTPPASAPHAPFDMRVTQLTTPAQQAAADTRRTRRSESLFTRITGFGLVRPSAQQEDPLADHGLDEQAAAQPSLNVNPSDRPHLSSEQPEDMLDIPAFLRRQTNH